MCDDIAVNCNKPFLAIHGTKNQIGIPKALL